MLIINAINFARSTAGAVKILTNNASKGPNMIPKIVPINDKSKLRMKPNILRIQFGKDVLPRIKIFKSDN